jgi:GWxTD domain-containing protein
MKFGSRILVACCICATIARPQTNSSKHLREELKSTYSKWPVQDVAYIITDEERSAFNGLNNDEEREQFIEEFWRRRDPTPETAENEFKEEHYRRIAYANEHFASGIPGWKTDRGRIYITFGPPDEIESHPSGGTYQRTPNEGG